MDNTIRVIIVDDSALVRRLLTEILSSDPEMEVVAAVGDPYVAREKIKTLHPDVMTLDVEMPRMDGITFLERLMRLRPMPVVMISSLTQKGADTTLKALELGAIDFIEKPKVGIADELKDYSDEIIQQVKNAARVNMKPYLNRNRAESTNPPRKMKISPSYSANVVLDKPVESGRKRISKPVIAMGASTGGTEAVREVIQSMPVDAPGILITQHIPAVFSASFASRLNELSAMNVTEATDGQTVESGHVYIAPGDKHLLLAGNNHRMYCRLSDGPPVNRHKPSVDVLFRSLASLTGENAIGVILTGMGSDGAEGLVEMYTAGSQTIAQDERSSVVWGMPGEAVKRGAACHILPIGQICEKILSLIQQES